MAMPRYCFLSIPFAPSLLWITSYGFPTNALIATLIFDGFSTLRYCGHMPRYGDLKAVIYAAVPRERQRELDDTARFRITDVLMAFKKVYQKTG